MHYSSSSGRWKLFADERQEQAFTVRGGLLWFHHVLIAAVEASKSFQIRLYSRDLELSNQNVLHREILTSPVVILSLVDNSLLVYTADNTLFHYLITPTEDTIKRHLCGSISFEGVVVAPTAVRVLSWMIPTAQKRELSDFNFFYCGHLLFYTCRTWRPNGRSICGDSAHDRRRQASTSPASKGMPLSRRTQFTISHIVYRREVKKSIMICKSSLTE